MKAFVNGRLVDEKNALVSAFDYGVLYGYGVFESMRAYGCRIFRLTEHMRRLRYSAKEVGIRFDVERIPGILSEVLSENNLADAYARVTLTYGPAGPRLSLEGAQKPSIVVAAGRIPETIAEKQRSGVRVGFSKIGQYSKTPLNRIKSTNYLQTALRKREAAKMGLDDVIALNERGGVVEASTSNVFLVDKKGRLVTPRIEDGCLPGVTREAVLEIAGKTGVEAVEKTVKPAELLNAREVFITNSVTEVVPVIRIGKTEIKIGEATKRIQGEYEKLVRKETAVKR